MNKSKAAKKLMELLGPGKYAEKIAQETTEAAKKTWKPGELVRTVEPPRVPDVDPKFAEEYLENLRRKASLNPTPENIKRFQEAELDLVGKLESKPRSVEEQEALRRLEEFTQPKEKKPSVLTKEEMRKKRELDKTKTDISTEKKPVDVLQETLETRVKENPTPENIEVLENFRKKRAAGEYPDLSRGLKVAGLAGAIGTGMSLAPEEAEAGVKGSFAARKKLLETTEKAMDAWTSGKKGASGGRELREQLQSQLDLDPTGAAKKEALRRLTAKTEVRQNPITGEHEFKVYRGDVKDRFSESPQSFTTDPDVAQEFADAYGGTVKEVWLPASKVGSVPSVMKEGKYLSSEGEVIAKPFKAESTLYIPKKESLHQRISERGKPAESTDLYEGWPEDVAEMARKSSKAAAIGGAIGAGALTAPSAQASEGPTVSQSSPEFTSDPTQSKSKDPLSRFEQKYGTYDIPGGVEKLLETVDKYTGRPARAAALSALKGENPITGAIESVSKDQDIEGQQVARQFLKNLEERGFKTRVPVDPKLEQLRELGVEIEGKKPEEYLPSGEFPAEGPLGFAADMALDPTNLAGMGLGTKVGKGFSKVRSLVK